MGFSDAWIHSDQLYLHLYLQHFQIKKCQNENIETFNLHQKRQECSIEWCAVIVNSTLSFYIFISIFLICILETKIIFMLSLLIQPWVARIEFSWQSIIWTNLQFEWHKYKFDSPLSFHKGQIPQKRDFLHINWFFLHVWLVLWTSKCFCLEAKF